MHKTFHYGALMALALITTPVFAGWYTYEHNTRDALVWHDTESHALDLKSGKNAGIQINKLSPDPLWGPRQNDAILAIDGHAVQHVDELLMQLNASKPADVHLTVRRDDIQQSLTLAASDYTRILAPQP